jgi:hypothetical protein
MNQTSKLNNVEGDPTAPPPPQLSPLLSLISSLQLDELELENELEELELEDHLEGPLLLLGWRVKTLAFALDVANEDGDGLREGVCPCLYSPVG